MFTDLQHHMHMNRPRVRELTTIATACPKKRTAGDDADLSPPPPPLPPTGAGWRRLAAYLLGGVRRELEWTEMAGWVRAVRLEGRNR